MRIVSLWCRNNVLVEHCEVARSLGARMKGLLGRDRLPTGHGLLIKHCGAVHTLGMRFPLDVVFLDRRLQVKKVIRQVSSGRWMVACRGARQVLELQAGSLAGDAISVGDVLELKAEVRG